MGWWVGARKVARGAQKLRRQQARERRNYAHYQAIAKQLLELESITVAAGASQGNSDLFFAQPTRSWRLTSENSVWDECFQSGSYVSSAPLLSTINTQCA